MENKIKLMISPLSFSVKPEKTEYAQITNSFKTETAIKEVTVKELVQLIEAGHPFAPAEFDGKGKKNENWVSQQIFVLDFDNDDPNNYLSYEDFLVRCSTYGLIPTITYHTYRSMESKEKFRAIFTLYCKITNVKFRDAVQNALGEFFPEHDKATDSKHSHFNATDKKVILNSEFGLHSPHILFYNLPKYYKDTDNGNNNYPKKISKFSTTTGLKVVNNKFKFLSTSIEQEIGEDEEVITFGVHKFYFSTKMTGKKFADVNIKIKLDRKTEYSPSKLDNLCMLWSNYCKGESITHEEKLHIIWNICNDENLSNKFLDVTSIFEPDNFKKREYDLNYARDVRNYFPQCCKNSNCRYYEQCRETNIINLLGKLAPEIISEKKYTSVEVARKELTTKMTEVLISREKGIDIICGGTGVGKTTLFFQSIKDKRFIYGTSNHNLKKEICEIAKNNGLIFSTLDSLPIFNDVVVNETIKNYYAIGDSKAVENLLRSLSKKDTRAENCSIADKEDILSARTFLEAKQEFRKYEGNRITTHQYIINNINDIPEDTLIVFDEDPTQSLEKSEKFRLEDLQLILDEYKNDLLELPSFGDGNEKFKQDLKHDIIVLEKIINKLKSFEIGKSYSKEDIGLLNISFRILLKYQHKLKIKNNIIGFENLTGLIISVSDGGTFVNYAYSVTLPANKQYLILSATPDINAYTKYGSAVRLHKISDIQNKGTIIQDINRSFSKTSINNLKEEDIELVKEIMNEQDVEALITHKQFKDNGTFDTELVEDNSKGHFNAVAGSNKMVGKNLMIAGTFNHNPQKYINTALARGYKIVSTEMSQQTVEWDGVKFSYYTFKDAVLRDIHLYSVFAESVQAVGRARLYDNDCTVLLLSNFALNGAVYKDMLKETKKGKVLATTSTSSKANAY